MRKFYKLVLALLFLTGVTSTSLAQCEIVVNVYSSGWGDVTFWELKDGSGTTVLSGGGYGNGYNDTQNTTHINPPYSLEFDIDDELCDNNPSYSVTVGGNQDISGTITPNCDWVTPSFQLLLGCPPATPVIPTEVSGTPDCLTGTDITVDYTPEADVVWYWQGTDANGTSTANPATSDFNVPVNGTYYLRAYNTVTDIWSTNSSSIVINSIPTATVPPAPFGTTPACLSTTLTADTPPSGTTYYWQTIPNGTDNSNDASTPLAVSTSGTYYLAAFDDNGCWSETSSLAVTIETFIPATPTVATDLFSICADATSQEIEAVSLIPETTSILVGTNLENPNSLTVPFTVPALPAGATITSAELQLTNVNSVNFSWRSEIRVALGGDYTLTPTQISTLESQGLISPDPVINLAGFPVTGGNIDLLLTETFDDGGAGTIDATFGEVRLVINYTVPATINWYEATTGNDFVGTGSPFETVGSSVMPTPLQAGSYDFYAEAVSGTCVSADRTLVTVVVNAVNVELTAIDESCIDYADGSFVLSANHCGQLPFTYSVDGGAFDNIPTNLTPGTYSVVVKDDNDDESLPIQVVVGTASTYIPEAPTAIVDVFNICVDATSQEIEAIAPASGTVVETSGDLNVSIPDNNPTGVSNSLTIAGIPVDATIDELFVTVNIQHTWNSDLDIYLTGANGTQIELSTDNGGSGDNYTNTVFSLNGVNPITGATAPMTGVFMAEGDMSSLISGLINGTWTLNVADDTGGDTGTLLNWSLEIQYSLPLATVNWYEAATGNDFVGTGSPFEAVDSPVMPTPLSNGSYEFYAEAVSGGCHSINRTLVTVNVNDVAVDFLVTDASCNNGNDGTFAISNVDCGDAPFSFTVDGVSVGTVIPTDLTTGTHTVTVTDANSNSSAEYTIVVGSAAGPDNVTVLSVTDEEIVVEWNVNGSDAQWTIEWGATGFTPGTGTEIGSANTTDNPFTITGLNADTEYDIYVAADCGTSPGDWGYVSGLTDCGAVSVPWCEDFEATSPTMHCWTIIDGNNDATAPVYSEWVLFNNITWSEDLAISGEQFAINFNQNTTTADDWLITPRIALTGNEVLKFNYTIFNYPSNFKVVLSTTGKDPADFTEELMADNSYSNDRIWEDTIVNLSAYNGTVYIAFVRSGATTTYSGVGIEDVCIDVCTPIAGTDGAIDVCRLDGTVDLSTVITSQYTHGNWFLPANQSVINGSTMNVSTLANATFDVFYVVEGGCTSDTTVASVTVFNPSSAGDNGLLSPCQNQPIDLMGALNGNVDFGGTWYDASGNALPSSYFTTGTLPGQFVYQYVVSNGVCDADTSEVIVNVGTCNWLGMEDISLLDNVSIAPNPNQGNFQILGIPGADYTYEVLDLNGRVVRTTTKITSTITDVNLTDVENGVYMIRIAGNDSERMIRVIKQN